MIRRLGGTLFILITPFILTGLTWSRSGASAERPTPPPPDGSEIDKENQRYPMADLRPHPPSQTVIISPRSPNTVDQFGYILDDSVPFNWVDVTTGSEVVFPAGDDSFSGPYDLGFEFKYYENAYTQVYINTNGTVNFVGGTASFDNQPMPQSTSPDNFVAPFWDDLTVGNLYNAGSVYYTTGGLPPDRYFAVEWHQVTRFGSSDILTFEVLLYENGDVLFQYLELNGELDKATVGIEDGDGVDGLVYLHNAQGLDPNMAVRFARPPAEARVKFLSTYESELTERRQTTYQLLLRNTGEMGADTYNLTASSSNPGWEITLSDGGLLLSDTNGDGQVDTGPIPQGEAYSLTIRLEAGPSQYVGAYTEVTITATSVTNPGKSSMTTLDAAMPASFAQAFTDGLLGRSLEFIWESHRSLPAIPSGASSGLALAATSNGSYIYAWEKSGLNGTVFFANIEYMYLNNFGYIQHPISPIVDNATALMQTADRMPALAPAPDGHTGVVWVREIFDQSVNKSNSNVFFTILDPAGEIAYGPVNVTQNSGWLGEGDLDIPSFTSPTLTATDDNRFILSWIDGRQQASGETQDLAYAIFDTQGVTVQSADIFAHSNPGVTLYLDPCVTSLSGGRAYLTYVVFDPGSLIYTVVFTVIDSAGNILMPETMLSGSPGWGPDALQLSQDKIFTAWTNPVTNAIAFAMLDTDDFTILVGPTTLTNPDTRPADFVSITTDPNGQAVLTWMDAKWNTGLYYALVADNGQVVTPAMVFRAGRGTSSLIKTSFSGQGNAPYVGSWQVFLPLLKR